MKVSFDKRLLGLLRTHRYLVGKVLQAILSSSSDGGRDEACEKPSSSELCEWFRGM